MKIVRLLSNNIKGLKAVDISPGNETFVSIAGANGHGKTAVLDSIRLALTGSSKKDGRLVRNGEESATIKCDLGNVEITRVIKPDGTTTLRIKGDSGKSISSPAQFLKEIVGNNIIDISAFATDKSTDAKKKRLEFLSKASGSSMSYEDYKSKRQKMFSDRTESNRELKHLKSEIEKTVERYGRIDIDTSIPNGPQDHTELISAYKEAGKLVTAIDASKNEIVRLQTQLKEEQEYLLEEERKLQAIEDKHGTWAEIEDNVETMQDTNQKALAKENLLKAIKEANEYKSKSDNLTNEMKEIDDEFINSIKSAISSEVSIEDDEIKVDGVPFEILSASQRIIFGIQLAMMCNPEVRVIYIEDASLLDERVLEEIKDIAHTEDIQIWAEMVGTKGDYTVIIEDGEIATSQSKVHN